MTNSLIQQLKKVLIIGGYGQVGGYVSQNLAQYPSINLLIAGRRIQLAQTLVNKLGNQHQALQIDLTKTQDYRELVSDLDMVIMCIDAPHIHLAEACAQQGVDYLDITASYTYLQQIEHCNSLAKQKGARIILSVGLAPGLTNLMVKQACKIHPETQKIEIYLLLGLGDQHGQAAFCWLLNNLSQNFQSAQKHLSSSVRSFSDGKPVQMLPDQKTHHAYRINLSDQHTLLKSLSLDEVTTRLCFDLDWLNQILAVLSKWKCLALLKHNKIQKIIFALMQKFKLGQDQWSLKVIAYKDSKPVYSSHIFGENEAQSTALIASQLAQQVLRSQKNNGGVFHIEQFTQLHHVISNIKPLANHFEESLTQGV